MMDPERLIDAYFEGNMSSNEQDDLLEWLRTDPQNVETFARAMHLEGALKDLVRPTEMAEASQHKPITAKTPKRRIRHRQTDLAGLPRRRGAPRYITAALTATAAMLTLVFGWVAYQSREAELKLTVVSLKGEAVINQAGGAVDVAARMQLAPGRSIQTTGNSMVRLQYPDGSVLHLAPNSEVYIFDTRAQERNKELRIVKGTISADVAKQPKGRPMILRGDHAVSTVVGTRFILRSIPGLTELSVDEGCVRFDSLYDGSTKLVKGGMCASTGPATVKTVKRATSKPAAKPNSKPGKVSAKEPAPHPMPIIDPIQHRYRFQVVSFSIVNSDNGQVIEGFENLKSGAVIDLSKIQSDMNIRANTVPEQVGSVAFDFNGEIGKRMKPFKGKNVIESFFPYFLNGDNRSVEGIGRWDPRPGRYTLTATPYLMMRARGDAGKSLTVEFTVIDGK